jgi:hypothetical protein
LWDIRDTKRPEVVQAFKDQFGSGQTQFDGHDIFVGYKDDTHITIATGAGKQPIDPALADASKKLLTSYGWSDQGSVLGASYAYGDKDQSGKFKYQELRVIPACSEPTVEVIQNFRGGEHNANYTIFSADGTREIERGSVQGLRNRIQHFMRTTDEMIRHMKGKK